MPDGTTEARAVRDDTLELRALGAQLFGISLDDAASHAGRGEIRPAVSAAGRLAGRDG
jgi:peroxiredoxin